jgi:membrane associated rhomboid family serine protease
MMAYLAFTPAAALSMPWTFITSVFMHGGIAHLFFNMFALFMFGPLLEQKIGSKRFLGLYLATGVIGNLGYLAYAYTMGNPLIPGVGASGAIYGLLGALAVLEPNLTIIAYPFFIPLPLWMAAIGWVVFEFAFLGAADLVGRAAHLAGIVAGAAYGQFLKKKAEAEWSSWE